MGSELMTRISRSLVLQEPATRGQRLAAVSIIINDRERPSVLLIRRAERSGDPWSGQIAFPGGKMQNGDRTAKDTAVRETLEEVGLDLASSSDFLGYGRLTATHTGTMDVVPTVFHLKKGVTVVPNEEVASFRWVGLGDLASPGARSRFMTTFQGNRTEFPALKVGDYTVWGLTHRILTSLLSGN
ncbi:MAG: CoA pyrophosphatase [Nitrososphaerota archaeon]|nr:CoA pyrophosphatase [Nitrososphaerota archaeon]